MGQSTSGTNLTTNAAASSRKIVYRFLVDWADDGFGSEGSWTDESVYVLDVRGTSQASGDMKSIAAVGHGVSDVVYVRCRNPEESNGNSGLRFSPTNSNGSLYTYIQEGRMNMKRAILEMGLDDSGTPERLRQITGYIVNATESFDRREITFEIRDRAADAALTRSTTVTYEYTTAKAYLAALCALLGRDAVAGGDQLFDDGMVVVPYYWLDEDKIWDEMHYVAEAHAGRIWFDKDGDLHFDDGTHFVKPDANSYDDPTTSQATFTVASFADLAPHYNLGSVYNHIIVDYQARYGGYGQVVFTASDFIILQPSESNKVYKAEFQNPVQDGSIQTPVADVDYTAVSPGGKDITSSVTVTVNDEGGGFAELYLTNADAGYAAYITKLEIRATPFLTQEPVVYEVEDATSIGYYGRRTWTVRSNPYIQTYRHAQMVGDFLLARFKDPVLALALRGVPARPWLEVGDRVTVTETLTDLNEDFFITKISWQFSPGRNSYLQDFTLMRVSDLFTYSDYFIIGSTQYGANYGRLFW